MDLCVVTCIINSIMDTNLVVCDTSRSAQNNLGKPSHLDQVYNTTNQENGNIIAQETISTAFQGPLR